MTISFASPRVWAGACASAIAAVGAVLVLGAAPALADSCQNAQFRTGPSASLPDCRAYEPVSTLDPPLGVGREGALEGYLTRAVAQVSTDGNSLAFTTAGPPPGAPSGSLDSWEVSRRGAEAWSAREQIPAFSDVDGQDDYPAVAAFSPDLGDLLMLDEQSLASGTQPHVAYVYDENTLTNAFSLVSATPSPLATGDTNMSVGGESSDLGTVLYSTESGDNNVSDTQTPNAPSDGEGVYESVGGSLSYAAFCPGSTQAIGMSSASPAGSTLDLNAVSANGQVVMLLGHCPPSSALETTDHPFTNVAMLVARVDGQSVEVSAPQLPAADMDPNWGDVSGSPQYVGVSADGSEVLFLSPTELTPDANTGSDSPGAPAGDTDAGRDLYQYDLATGKLTDLTPDANPNDVGPNAVSPGADVLGGIEFSSDGLVVYFVADGDLAAGATDGRPNLYVETGGKITFIATLSTSDSYTPNGVAAIQYNTLQATSDGKYLLFESAASLTGYDNTDAVTGQPDDELYRYTLATGKLNCVSCDPDGSQPDGSAIAIPAAFEGGQAHMAENMSRDGSRVFFESTASLLPQASNGVSNVYEWELDGTGSCGSSSDAGGCLYLLTPGNVADAAMLSGSSPTGNDVFIQTQQALAPPGADGVYNIYDARVGGGFPSTPMTTPVCTSTACTTAGSSPAPPVVGTVSFSGPGNAPAGRATTPKAVTGKVRAGKHATKTVIKGSAFVIVARVPAKGWLTVTGPRVKRLAKKVGKAGRVKLTVHLSKEAAKRLKTEEARRARPAKRRVKGNAEQKVATIKLRVEVAYRPYNGTASSVTVTVTVRA